MGRSAKINRSGAYTKKKNLTKGKVDYRSATDTKREERRIGKEKKRHEKALLEQNAKDATDRGMVDDANNDATSLSKDSSLYYFNSTCQRVVTARRKFIIPFIDSQGNWCSFNNLTTLSTSDPLNKLSDSSVFSLEINDSETSSETIPNIPSCFLAAVALPFGVREDAALTFITCCEEDASDGISDDQFKKATNFISIDSQLSNYLKDRKQKSHSNKVILSAIFEALNPLSPSVDDGINIYTIPSKFGFREMLSSYLSKCSGGDGLNAQSKNGSSGKRCLVAIKYEFADSSFNNNKIQGEKLKSNKKEENSLSELFSNQLSQWYKSLKSLITLQQLPSLSLQFMIFPSSTTTSISELQTDFEATCQTIATDLGFMFHAIPVTISATSSTISKSDDFSGIHSIIMFVNKFLDSIHF